MWSKFSKDLIFISIIYQSKDPHNIKANFAYNFFLKKWFDQNFHPGLQRICICSINEIDLYNELTNWIETFANSSVKLNTCQKSFS